MLTLKMFLNVVELCYELFEVLKIMKVESCLKILNIKICMLTYEFNESTRQILSKVILYYILVSYKIQIDF